MSYTNQITQEDAFAVVDGQVSVPIDTSKHPIELTRRWFRSRNQSTWSTFFPKKLDSSKPIKMLQIGVFEGADLVWMFQNILKNEHSRAVAIDPWLVTSKLDQGIMDSCHERALGNLRPYQNKLEIYRGLSQEVMPDLIENPISINGVGMGAGEYDIIVIDGDHNAPAVHTDAINALTLVAVGGWLVFDDVRNARRKKNHVIDGIETFLAAYGDCVKLQWQNRYVDCYMRVK